MATLTPAEYRSMVKPKHKYGAIRTEYNGAWYDSKAEAAYAAELDMMKRIGVVKDWWRQVPFVLHAVSSDGGFRTAIGKYIVDFKILGADDTVTYCDVKGVATPLFKWKKKHAEAEYGVKIVLVKR
jgi:hypothetical protein